MTDKNNPFAALTIGRTEDEPQRAASHPIEHENRPMSITISDDGRRIVQYHDTANTAHSHDAITPGNSGFTMIQSKTGVPQSVYQVTEESVVGISGYGPMKLSTALSVGLAMRKPDGTYAPIGDSEQSAQRVNETQAREQDEAEEHPDLRMEAADEATEKTFKTIVDNTAPATQATAVREIAEKGALSDRTLYELAGQLHGTPDQVNDLVDSARSGFETQAKNAVAATGLDPDAVFAWAYEHEPKLVSEAIKKQLTLRQTNGYRELANMYAEQLDVIDPDSILNAQLADGLTARREGKKIILTAKNGRTYEWRSAVRAGIINIGKRR